MVIPQQSVIMLNSDHLVLQENVKTIQLNNLWQANSFGAGIIF